MRSKLSWQTGPFSLVLSAAVGLALSCPALAAPVPGGTLDPTTIPKYVIPLVIPPEMPKSVAGGTPAANYNIAVRQFKQQILPGGIWGGALPATTIWSYGRAEDPAPDSTGIPGGGAGIAPATNSSFNYPAFTIENTSNTQTKVRWINDLVDSATGNFLPHLFSVDQTLHWANPPAVNCTMMPTNRTDCETAVPTPYTGPVPLVTHVHGSHVQAHSDGYPESWWLPAANNIPAGYSMRGSKFTQADNTNAVAGSAFYSYENTQPAATLWYHDHALGMTRLNVYAGPAGFWMVRGGANDTAAGVLPGPAPTVVGGDPNFNATVRQTIREIPIVIQDRSFNSDGSLFYPADRTFFDGFTGPYIGGTGTPAGPSDISGIWNPEAFFNTMVVNGTTWPKFDVAPARYRLRLLNGCNSRTLNLALFTVTSIGADALPGTADDVLGAEIPIYQIGAEQGFLPKVVKIQTGFYTTLPGNGTTPAAVAAPDPAQALLMGPAERADIIVDFGGMVNGARIRMINTAPDAPFGGFPDVPADSLTTGQVMDFIVNTALPAQPTDTSSTPPVSLALPVEATQGVQSVTRKVSLNELSSDQVCVEVDAVTGTIVGTLFSTTPGDPAFQANCAAAPVAAGNVAQPMGPRQAQLGVLLTDSLGNVTGALPKRWGDGFTETPAMNATEVWEIYNTTMDAHPIHLHLVRFEVIERQSFDPVTFAPLAGTITPALPYEAGYKDTVVAFPGQITRIKAKFDITGLYVWHCHIVEHEDNEMMRPYLVAPAKNDFNNDGKADILWRNTATGQNAVWLMNGTTYVSGTWLYFSLGTTWNTGGVGDFNSDGKPDILWRDSATGQNAVWLMNGTNIESGVLIKSLATAWSIGGVGDFDSDGKPDILWRNSTTGQNAVWFMDGTTYRSGVYINPLGTAWNVGGVGDFDADGKPDILWRNSTTGQNAIWLMNGTTYRSGVFINSLGAAWNVGGVGDYDTDGKIDILWRNPTTGQNAVWLMNGTVFRSSVLFNSLNGAAWSIAVR